MRATDNRRWQWRTLLRRIALRAAVWGGLTVAVLAYLVDFRSLVGPIRPAAPVRATLEAEGHEAPASGWPQLRGAAYDAHAADTDLADSWPAQGPPLLWAREIGRGYSAIIAVGGRAVTQRQTLTGQSVLCLDAATGDTVWEHRYGWPYEPGGMYPGPRSTPTWSGGMIYFAEPEGLVGCLRASDGWPVWSVNVMEKYQGRGADFGYAASPVVEDGKVILPVGGERASVVALDAGDGSLVWASGTEEASYCSVLPICRGGRRLLVAFLKNTLAGFDLASGELLWEEQYSRGYDEHAAMPVYDEPLLMTMLPFRAGSNVYAIEEGADGGLALRRVRHGKEMSNDTASSVLVDGFVYGFDVREAQTSRHRPTRGQFKCIELASGDVRWASDHPGHATVAVADGKLFLFSDTGELILARANPDRYEELARTPVFPGEMCWTAPTLHRGCVFLRSPTRAACLYVGKPERLPEAQRSATRPASEAVAARSPAPVWLIAGEREYPYDAPDLAELARWFLAALAGALLPAGVVAEIAAAFARRRRPAASRAVRTGTFWPLLFVLAVAATPLANRLVEEFIFTWPAGLFAAHQLALAAIVWANQAGDRRRSQWLALAGAVLLLAVCVAYYDLCGRLTLGLTWVFLMGFLPTWPLAIPAARRMLAQRHPACDYLWTLSAFSLYYWASAAMLLWRTPS